MGTGKFWRFITLENKLPLSRIVEVKTWRGFHMRHEKHWQQMLQYQPEAWRTEGNDWGKGARGRGNGSVIAPSQRPQLPPDVQEQTRVLELLGRVNYKIIK